MLTYPAPDVEAPAVDVSLKKPGIDPPPNGGVGVTFALLPRIIVDGAGIVFEDWDLRGCWVEQRNGLNAG